MRQQITHDSHSVCHGYDDLCIWGFCTSRELIDLNEGIAMKKSMNQKSRFFRSRHVSVRRFEDECLNEQCIILTVKYGGGSVIWDWFGSTLLGDIVKIQDIKEITISTNLETMLSFQKQ